MHHHINHCFCTQAEGTNDFYDAGNIVEVNSCEADADDWDKIVDIKRVVSIEDLRMQRNVAKKMAEGEHKVVFSEEQILNMSTKDCPALKDEVRQWLNDNIKEKAGEPGWAIGNEQYRLIEHSRLSIFFQRRNDAKKFIKTFSKYKKSTSYFNYLKDPIDNKILNTETGKYYDRHGD